MNEGSDVGKGAAPVTVTVRRREEAEGEGSQRNREVRDGAIRQRMNAIYNEE